MRLLLDTHILLWWLGNSSLLSVKARELIADPKSIIYVSAASLWEIWIKQCLGKLHLPQHFESRLQNESFEHLPVTARHAREVALLPMHHRDPFDRMLIAQAKTEGMRLLTLDGRAAAYGDCVLLC